MADTLDPRVAGFGLDPIFAGKLVQLLDACAAQGFHFKVIQGLRTPEVQAQYYCQSQPAAKVQQEIAALQAAGADWLAGVLQANANTPAGRWQTSQLPGSGWHQWGEAADCYCFNGTVMISSGADPCYKAYADLAVGFGLTAGYYFTTHQDSGHVQLRPQAGARDVYSWHDIDTTMKARFGGKPTLTDV